MKLSNISVVSNLKLQVSPNYDGLGEDAWNIALPTGDRLLLVVRGVAEPFWSLQTPAGSAFSIQILDRDTRYRSMAKGFFSDSSEIEFDLGSVTLLIAGNRIKINSAQHNENETEAEEAEETERVVFEEVIV